MTHRERPRLTRPPGVLITALNDGKNESDGRAWAAMMSDGFGLTDARIGHFRRAVGDGEIRLARRNGQAIATATLMPMAQWFGGRPVPVAGIAAVTVAACERRRGIAATLLRALLIEARDRGLALAILHAATLPLYRRLGFARAGGWTVARLSVARTLAPLADSARRAPLRLSRADTADSATLATLTALRRRLGVRSNGLLERPPSLWADLLSPCDRPPPEVHLIQGENGAAAGYLLLPAAANDTGILTLTDQCLLNGDAVEQALSFLASRAQALTEVRWPGGPDDPLAFLAPEVDVDIDDWDLWLARVLDVAGALSARGYPEALGACLDLVIDDPLITANHGRWRLTVAAGRATVTAHTQMMSAVPTLHLPVTALAPLLTGHIGAPALSALGLLDGDSNAVALAAALFAGPPPWLADRF